MEQKICQCCAMPIDESTFGTEADGSINKDSKVKYTIDEALATMKEFFPQLKRWKK